MWNAHLVLHAMLADAVEDGLIRSNPAAKACPAPEESEAEAWSADELCCLLDAASAHRLFAAFRLKAHGGLRRSELVGLPWRRLDFDAGTVTIISTRVKGRAGPVSGKPKSKRSERTIDLDPQTIRVLREHRSRYLSERIALRLGAPGPDDLVFVGINHQALYPDTVSKAFDRIVKRRRTRCAACGTRLGEDSARCPECNADHRPIKRLTIHGLRHTHGTLLLLAGMPLHVVSRRLGHANEAFTARVYGHVLPQQGADAAVRFAALVDDDGPDETREDEEG